MGTYISLIVLYLVFAVATFFKIVDTNKHYSRYPVWFKVWCWVFIPVLLIIVRITDLLDWLLGD